MVPVRLPSLCLLLHITELHTATPEPLHILQSFLSGIFHILLRYTIGIGEMLQHTGYAGFPQEVDHRVYGTVGIIGRIIICTSGEKIIGMEAGDLVNTVISFGSILPLCFTYQVQVIAKAVQSAWINDESGFYSRIFIQQPHFLQDLIQHLPAAKQRRHHIPDAVALNDRCRKRTKITADNNRFNPLGCLFDNNLIGRNKNYF